MYRWDRPASIGASDKAILRVKDLARRGCDAGILTFPELNSFAVSTSGALSFQRRRSLRSSRRSSRRSVRRLTPCATTAAVATVVAVRATGAGPITAARRKRLAAKGMSGTNFLV